MKKWWNASLRRRMVMGMILMLVPLLAIISLLFLNTMKSEQEGALESLLSLSEQISDSIDSVATRSYNASDVFSDDSTLLEKIDQQYTDDTLKKAVIVQVLNRQLESYNRLADYKKIDAIAVQPYDEVYDFLDPNQDEELIKTHIRQMGMDDKDKLGQFHWYSLRTNFLTTSRYGDPRRDNVVFGSRRVYSILRNGYPYLHIFAVPEQSLHDAYAQDAARAQAEVYVLNEQHELISSTDLDAVKRCVVPEDIKTLIRPDLGQAHREKYKGQQYYLAGAWSDRTGWITLVMTPDSVVTAPTRSLYGGIMWVFLICAVCCVAAPLFLYRKFMEPVAEIDASMEQVEAGDLHAYVTPKGEHEMVLMMQRYNNMLQSIERNITQRLDMERTKKELEMQVLITQVNPHFLYNTLETIVWKAGEAGHPEIGRIAASLGKLYRLSISGGTFVPLSQELEHVQAYAAIQKNRHGDKIDFSVRLQDIDPAHCRMLKLTLQPIVENCYLYAGEGLTRTLKIRVSISCRKGRLIIHVTDNGIGMSPGKLSEIREQMRSGKSDTAQPSPHRSTGIGLHNVSARLKIHEAGGDMRLYSWQNRGTCVVLDLPLEEP